MAKALKKGDPVSWKSHGGEANGKIVRKITEPTRIKGHKVAASPTIPNSSSRRTRASAPRTSPGR